MDTVSPKMLYFRGFGSKSELKNCLCGKKRPVFFPHKPKMAIMRSICPIDLIFSSSESPGNYEWDYIKNINLGPYLGSL